jgi:hypothetical protein
MSDGIQLDDDRPEATSVEDQVSPSILDRLRAHRDEAQKQHFLILPIAGFQDDLAARYHPVPFRVFEEAEKRNKKDKSGSKILLAALDQMIACCDQILVKDPGHEDCVLNNDGTTSEYRPIDPHAASTNFPIKWEPRLGPLIGIPEEEYNIGQAQQQNRQVILRTFCNDAAVIHHATQVGIWLRDTTKDVDDELLGN